MFDLGQLRSATFGWLFEPIMFREKSDSFYAVKQMK